MEYSLRKQKGYLLFLAILILVVLAFAATTLLAILQNKTDTTNSFHAHNQSMNVAVSGLEIAKRDVTVNAVSCDNLASLHTNESLLSGVFTASGSDTSATSSLSSLLLGTNGVNITLSNASSFAPSGIIKVDNEYIYYGAKTGNTLTQVSRGKNGSTIQSHLNGTSVSQSQCFIQVTAGVPNLTSPSSGISALSTAVVYSGSGSGGGFSFNGYQPTAVAGGTVTLTSNARVYNSAVTLNGGNYPGSTIVSERPIIFWNNAETAVNNGSGSPVESSSRSNGLLADTQENVTASTPIFESYFGTMTKSEIISTAQSSGTYYSFFNTYFDAPGLNGKRNQIIYVNSSLSLYGNYDITIGSPSQPVLLYINSNLYLHNNSKLTVYGIVFVGGSAQFSSNAKLLGEGSIGVTNTLSLHNNAKLDLSLAPGNTTLDNLYNNVISAGGSTTYTSAGFGIQQEVP